MENIPIKTTPYLRIYSFSIERKQTKNSMLMNAKIVSDYAIVRRLQHTMRKAHEKRERQKRQQYKSKI